MYVYSMAHCVCLLNIKSIELHTLHLNIQIPSESVHDLGVGGRHLAISLYKLKASGTTYRPESHCLHAYTVTALIANWPAKYRMVISCVAEVGGM